MSTLSLSCDNFHENIANGLLWMLESEHCANVTIAVEGRYLKAHQMVLSMCSPYFHSLLEANTCNYPIVFMKDVKYHIMQNLLRFMYEGQTQIEAEDSYTFVETAQTLQIKWLMNIATKTEHKLDQHPHSSPTPSYAMKRKYKPRTPERNNATTTTMKTAIIQVQEPLRFGLSTDNDPKRAKSVPTSTIYKPEIIECDDEYENGGPVITTVVGAGEERGLDHRFFQNPVDILLGVEEYDLTLKTEQEDIDTTYVEPQTQIGDDQEFIPTSTIYKPEIIECDDEYENGGPVITTVARVGRSFKLPFFLGFVRCRCDINQRCSIYSKITYKTIENVYFTRECKIPERTPG